MNVAKIGKASDIEAIIDYMREIEPEEVLIVYRHRNSNGGFDWSYDHTRLSSKFNMIGALHWVQTALADID